ncbi:MAG: L,D-transpeptidase family protein [Verrucomicrobiia bacterium]
MIVSTAPDWNSMRGSMRLFERRGTAWVPVSGFIPVLFGKNGLAWGRGIASGNQPPLFKCEGDGRAPAGKFRLGKIYTPDPALPRGANYPFHRLGPADAWVDDVDNPYYNQHVFIPDPAKRPPWFESQRMRVGDFAYRWLVDIRHNRDDIVPGAGSAIFFHIRRGEARPSHGCTTMAEEDLVRMIRWLRADANPVYVLLPRREYRELWRRWKLPPPELAIPGG